MKILHLLSQRPEQTGSGIFIRAMIRYAHEKGCKNGLLTGVPDNIPIPDIPVSELEPILFHGPDLPFPVVGMSDIMPYPSRTFISLTPEELTQYLTVFSKKATALIDRFQPDIIHSHHLWLMTARIRQCFNKIPFVTTCHGSDLRQFTSCPHLRNLVLEPCRSLNAVMALSQTQKTEIIRLYGIDENKIHVTGAGYDSSLFTPAAKYSNDGIILTYAGKLSRAKGVIYLLKALSKLTHLPWHLNLAGDGTGQEKAEILDYTDTMNGRTIWHGMKSQSQLAAILKKTHIFILPSFFEGLPLVLLEALACNCRLISTALPGVKELFTYIKSDKIDLIPLPPMQTIDKPRPETESLFIDALANALNRQITNTMITPDFDRKAFTSILENYTWQGVFNRVNNIYERWV